MLKVNDYVNRKNTSHPTGIIEALNGNMTATVRWGIQDRYTYREEIPLDQLVIVLHTILSPDEVIRQQAEKSGTSHHEIEE